MRSEQERELKRILDEAFRAFEAGDDAAARRLCRQALAIDPESSTAHSLMGLLYEREGMTSEASGEFAQVVGHNPQSEAERNTLRRLRGDLPAAYEDEERRSMAPIIAAASVAALVVFIAIVLGFRALTGSVRDNDRVAVASANIEEDLALAREAFANGQYRPAMEASARVLEVQPNHAVARDIYERSRAFLQGTEQPPAPVRPPIAPAAPTQVRAEPAVGGGPATNIPAVAVAPAAVVGGGSGGSTSSRGPASASPRISNLPPAGNFGRGDTSGFPSPSASGTGSRSQQRAPTGYDPTAASSKARSTRPTRIYRPVAPTPRSYDDIAPADRVTPAERTTIGGGSGTTADSEPDSYVRVEVRRVEPGEPTGPGEEVTPDLSGAGSTAPSASAGTPTDPNLARLREEERRRREARQRQQTAGARRAE